MGRKSLANIRKPEILEHFYQVIIEEGLQGASIAKIAKHMGVNPSLLTHYFTTKEEMVVELIDFIYQKYLETFISRIKKVRDPEKRFDALLNAFFGLEWDKLVEDSAFYACFYLGFRNEEAKARMKKTFSELRDFVRNEIEFGIKEGIVKETDPELVADLIISVQEGISFYDCVIDNDGRSEAMYQYLKEGAKKLLKK